MLTSSWRTCIPCWDSPARCADTCSSVDWSVNRWWTSGLHPRPKHSQSGNNAANGKRLAKYAHGQATEVQCCKQKLGLPLLNGI